MARTSHIQHLAHPASCTPGILHTRHLAHPASCTPGILHTRHLAHPASCTPGILHTRHLAHPASCTPGILHMKTSTIVHEFDFNRCLDSSKLTGSFALKGNGLLVDTWPLCSEHDCIYNFLFTKCASCCLHCTIQILNYWANCLKLRNISFETSA